MSKALCSTSAWHSVPFTSHASERTTTGFICTSQGTESASKSEEIVKCNFNLFQFTKDLWLSDFWISPWPHGVQISSHFCRLVIKVSKSHWYIRWSQKWTPSPTCTDFLWLFFLGVDFKGQDEFMISIL